ncbi:translocation/assembly module TamB [Candidatus Binatia bacterium]|nr:translocation/assembly module TamB [Candidatus Binatia bacterium]
MKWTLRILLAAVVLAVALAVVLWRATPRLTATLQEQIEHALAAAAQAPATVGSLRLSLAPPGLDLRDVTVGPEGALLRLGGFRLEVAPVRSLLALRPVFDLRITDVAADLTALPPLPASETDAAPWLPPLRLDRGVVDGLHLRFPMDNGPGTLSVERIEASGETGWRAARVEGEVRVAEAHLQRRKYSARLHTVDAHGGVDDTGVFVRDGRVVGDGIEATVAPTATAGRVAVRGTFRPGILGVLVDELALIEGTASVEGALEGDLAQPVLDATLVIENGALAGRPIGDLSARARFRDVNLHFEEVRMVGPAGKLNGDVDLLLEKEVQIRVDVEAEDLDLQGILAATGVEVPLRVRMDGTTRMRGQLDPPDFTVFGNGAMRSLAGAGSGAEAAWDASVRLLKDDLAVRLAVRQAGNRIGGELMLVHDRLGGGVSVDLDDVAVATPLLPLAVVALAPSGQLRGDAVFSGTVDRPGFGGTVAGRNLTLGGAPIRRVNGDFAIGAEGLITRETIVETPAGIGVFAGTVALQPEQRNDWSLRLDELDSDGTVRLVEAVTGTRLPVGGGTLSGRGRCTGSWADARCEADVEARWLRVGAEPFRSVRLLAAGTLPAWEGRLRAERTAAEALTIAGSGVGLERIDLRVDSDPLRLASIFAGAEGVDGRVRVEGQLSGAPERLDGEVTLTATDVAVRRHAFGEVRVRGVARGGGWTVDGSALDGAVSLRVAIPAAATAVSDLALRWRDLEVGPLLDAGGALSVRSAGSVDLRGRGIAFDAATGTIAVSELNVDRGDYRVSAREPVVVRVDRGRFSVVSAVLEGPKSRLTVAGEWAASGSVDLRFDGDGDLVLLELAVPGVQSASGPFTVDARVRHQPGGVWDLAGEAQVRDGLVDAGLPVVLAGVDSTVVMRGAVIEVRELRGRAGSGSFAVDGTLDLDHGPALRWQVDDVAMTAPEWLEERFSGRGAVEGSWERILVRGGVDVDYVLYERDVEITDFLPWLKGQLAPPPAAKAPARVVALDLHIRAPDSIFVHNNYARAELEADLRVGGTVDAPSVTGVVQVVSGDVTVNKRVFTVTGGAVDFRDPTRINPVLNLSAETQILTKEGLYLVTATVTGTADQPRVQLGSDDPSLTQNDILSLVATGRTAKQAAQDKTGFSPASALAFVPTRGFQDFLSQTIGLDLFELDTGRVEDTGPVLPRVTVGKQLTEDLRVTASNTLVETLTRVTLDYRLGRRFSVYGTWESQSTSQAGAFGGGGTLRYNFRGSPFSLLRGLGNLDPPVDAP